MGLIRNVIIGSAVGYVAAYIISYKQFNAKLSAANAQKEYEAYLESDLYKNSYAKKRKDNSFYSVLGVSALGVFALVTKPVVDKLSGKKLTYKQKFIGLVTKSINTFPMKQMKSSLEKEGYSNKSSFAIIATGIIVGLPTPIPGGSIITAGTAYLGAKGYGKIHNKIKKAGDNVRAN